ncbi:WD40 repeat [Dillenia turbinata]|uniref:WD40 repeat n=1 Tax=Dillenia turbinata TaxID=194707 RepID=A0AAN8W964_9MAGN
MSIRRTMTMSWEGLGDDNDDDQFFESIDRFSAAVPLDLLSSDSDNDDFDDTRMSFASTISSASSHKFQARVSERMPQNYDIWMAAPGSITERRKRLFQGMGLVGDKEQLRLASMASRRDKSGNDATGSSTKDQESKLERTTLPIQRIVLVRSRSDGDMEPLYLDTKSRKEQLIGTISKQRLTRTLSTLAPCARVCRMNANVVEISPKDAENAASIRKGRALSTMMSNSRFGAFFLIKNLDTGKEFIVKEFDEDGMWNRFSDLQTGKQMTLEEFEKCVGHSPVVKELMRRAQVSKGSDDNLERKVSTNSYLTKSFRYSKRRGVAFFKNIKGVANSMSGMIGEQREHSSSEGNKNEWIKVRQQGKSHKELSAMHLCQEIQAHQGSIWTIKFSLDSHYLASAGEDREIHIWEVQECDVMSSRLPDDVFSMCHSTPLHPMAGSSTYSSPLHPMAGSSPLHSASASPEGSPEQASSTLWSSPSQSMAGQSMDRPPLPEKKKKGKGSANKKGQIPDYVYVPETVFSLSEKPICSFKGHLDDILDLSWSKSQLLLSSSMDKTVRLWDMESRSCLKLFAHNDYVTCIQFNPVDERYFISGSLDAKVRIWSISAHSVVNWTDLHEMVTAASYSPDGQGAIVGSHKGSCRLYDTAGTVTRNSVLHFEVHHNCKLEQIGQIAIPNQKKSNPKKVTGFQYAPENPSEVLITSADSRIRIYDGSDFIHKFIGFRNTSSQISASFTPDGKYVVSASEDSQVYIWKREESPNVNGGKSKACITARSYEYFHCKDVSVAIPWNGSLKAEPPAVPVHSKRHSKHSTPQPSSANASPTREDNNLGTSTSKRQLPPLPKKSSTIETASTCQEDELTSPTDTGIGSSESFTSPIASMRYNDSPSISASSNFASSVWSPSWSFFDAGSSQQTTQATAWGMVIVTAGVEGTIKVYQNFGLPIRVGRQANLFKDLA